MGPDPAGRGPTARREDCVEGGAPHRREVCDLDATPLGADAVRHVVDRVDRALPFMTVTCAGSPATVWFADVRAHVRAGSDPLRPWREALGGQMSQRHGVPTRAHVPAAFVLQWWCQVAATPIAYAAVLGPWVLAPSPAGLSKSAFQTVVCKIQTSGGGGGGTVL